MQKKYSLFLKSLMISLMCCVLFVGVGYYYIDANLKPVQNKAENVPFAQDSPDNAGILLEMAGDKTFFYLDFATKRMYIALNPEEENNQEIFGYKVDYRVSADLGFLSDAIDYVGGIELIIENNSLRYTGVQVCELVQISTDRNFKREVVEKVCEKIAQNGIALDFFANIIEICDTNLTIPNCYFWEEEISLLCQNLQIID